MITKPGSEQILFISNTKLLLPKISEVGDDVEVTSETFSLADLHLEGVIDLRRPSIIILLDLCYC
jgi:hypothetical protein